MPGSSVVARVGWSGSAGTGWNLVVAVGADPFKALVAGGGAIAVEKGIGAALNRPAIVNWISKPVPADLAALSRLPEPARATLTRNLQAIIDQERSQGRNVPIAPAVAQLLATGAAASAANDPTKPIRTRQEAMQLLGH